MRNKKETVTAGEGRGSEECRGWVLRPQQPWFLQEREASGNPRTLEPWKCGEEALEA